MSSETQPSEESLVKVEVKEEETGGQSSAKAEVQEEKQEQTRVLLRQIGVFGGDQVTNILRIHTEEVSGEKIVRIRSDFEFKLSRTPSSTNRGVTNMLRDASNMILLVIEKERSQIFSDTGKKVT